MSNPMSGGRGSLRVGMANMLLAAIGSGANRIDGMPTWLYFPFVFFFNLDFLAFAWLGLVCMSCWPPCCMACHILRVLFENLCVPKIAFDYFPLLGICDNFMFSPLQ